MTVNNTKHDNEYDIAAALNAYFAKTGDRIQNALKAKRTNIERVKLSNSCPASIYMNPCSIEEIRRIIDKLKNKTSESFDEISPKLLKLLKESLVFPLYIIINKCLNEGVFPEKLKLAKVYPLAKCSQTEYATNYRPISILSAFSKVFEKVINCRLVSFFDRNRILYDKQYGFRPKHSTIDAVYDLITGIENNLEKRMKSLVTFVDLSKAFDSIDHSILFSKLDLYGIRGTPLRLLQSYLTGRKQAVAWNKIVSGVQNINCGVPQGSILGPLLFLIYVNDLHLNIDAEIIQYADDTTIILNENTVEDLNQKGVRCLTQLQNWLVQNKLLLNLGKSKCMLFGASRREMQRINIGLHNTYIDCVNDYKLLGIVLDVKLSWRPHIDTVKNKINKSLYAMRRLKSYFPKHLLRAVYFALVQTHIDYGLKLWGNASRNTVKDIVIQQKKGYQNN